MHNSWAIPGDALGLDTEFTVGDGAYRSEGGIIRSSLVGNIVIEELELKKKINVISPFILARQRVISVGDIVLCRVTKINNNQAFVEVLHVGEIELDSPAKAVIHKEDIRLKEIDKVVVGEFFKPGDLVRASVISLGDNKHYFLSTAADGLGRLEN